MCVYYFHSSHVCSRNATRNTHTASAYIQSDHFVCSFHKFPFSLHCNNFFLLFRFFFFVFEQAASKLFEAVQSRSIEIRIHWLNFFRSFVVHFMHFTLLFSLRIFFLLSFHLKMNALQNTPYDSIVINSMVYFVATIKLQQVNGNFPIILSRVFITPIIRLQFEFDYWILMINGTFITK